MELLDKAYQSYYGTNSLFSTKTKQMKIPKNKFLDILKFEKQMSAELIEKNLKDTNNFVEFSDAFYTDEDILLPTISENLANNDKKATLISPYIRNEKNKKGLSTIRTSIERPFYIYDEIVTPRLISDLNDVDCFIVNNINHPKLMNHFITWSSLGVTCIFILSGQMDERFKTNSNNIARAFIDATKDNKLSYEVGINYDIRTNSAARMYAIKRK